jgi:hypothetical protein
MNIFMSKWFQINVTHDSCALPLCVNLMENCQNDGGYDVGGKAVDIQVLFFHFTFTWDWEDE